MGLVHIQFDMIRGMDFGRRGLIRGVLLIGTDDANIYVLVMKMFVLFYIIAVFFDEDWLI